MRHDDPARSARWAMSVSALITVGGAWATWTRSGTRSRDLWASLDALVIGSDQLERWLRIAWALVPVTAGIAIAAAIADRRLVAAVSGLVAGATGMVVAVAVVDAVPATGSGPWMTGVGGALTCTAGIAVLRYRGR